MESKANQLKNPPNKHKSRRAFCVEGLSELEQDFFKTLRFVSLRTEAAHTTKFSMNWKQKLFRFLFGNWFFDLTKFLPDSGARRFYIIEDSDFAEVGRIAKQHGVFVVKFEALFTDGGSASHCVCIGEDSDLLTFALSFDSSRAFGIARPDATGEVIRPRQQPASTPSVLE